MFKKLKVSFFKKLHNTLFIIFNFIHLFFYDTIRANRVVVKYKIKINTQIINIHCFIIFIFFNIRKFNYINFLCL